MNQFHQGYKINARSIRRKDNIKAVALFSLFALSIIWSGFQPSTEMMAYEKHRCDEIGETYHVQTTYEYDTRDCITAKPIYFIDP